MQDYQRHSTGDGQVLWFCWSFWKTNHHLKLICYCLYGGQDKCASIIDINLISYIIHVSTDSLILNKWLFCKRYSVTSITGEMNADEWAEVVQAFNNDESLKNLTNFSDILVDTTALIGQDYTLTRSFQLVIMGSEWLMTEKDQCVEQIWHLRQNNRCIIFYHLIRKKVKIEKNILNKQTLWKKFEEMIFNFQNKLKFKIIKISNNEI